MAAVSQRCSALNHLSPALGLFQLHLSILEQHRLMDLSIKRVPEEQVARLRERAKANHRSLQGELRALIEEATSAVPRKLSMDEVAARVAKLGLKRRNEAMRLIRADRDR
jgi:plasmid stability protein